MTVGDFVKYLAGLDQSLEMHFITDEPVTIDDFGDIKGPIYPIYVLNEERILLTYIMRFPGDPITIQLNRKRDNEEGY